MPFDLATIGALAVLGALVGLPGAALARPLTAAEPDPLVRAGLAAGVGLALWPVLLLWMDLAGLPLEPGTAVLAALFAAGLAGLTRVVRSALRARRARRPLLERFPLDRSSPRHPATAATLALLALLLAARWWAAREVSVPLWGDSVHHAMIVALFDAQDGLPDDWQPYAPLATFTYHFGLHAVTAVVAQVSGLPAHRALIVVGQALMVLQALTAYALVAGLSGRRWAGFGAALAAAGLGTMPGFYLNWGRYTQLAGQVLLPIVALATVRVVGAWSAGGIPGTAASPGARRPVAPRSAVAALLVAGLALTHYLVTLFFVLFVAAWLLVGPAARTAPHDGERSGPAAFLWRRARAVPPLLAIAAGGLLLAAPWIPRFLGGRLDNHAAALLTTQLPDENVWGLPPPSYVWGHLATFVGWPLVAAAALGLAWALLDAWGGRRLALPEVGEKDASRVQKRGRSQGDGDARVRLQRVAWLGCAWTLLLLMAAYPALIGLPITGPLKDFTVFIGLYLPLGLLVGVLTHGLAAGLGRVGAGRTEDGAAGPARTVATTLPRGAWSARAPLAAATLLAAVVTFADRAVIDEQHVLATPADERAMAWIAANTPPDAGFLVSAGPAYGDTVVAGEDGGWWLSQLAGRRTTLPPITYGLEPGIEPDWRQQVNALNAAWRADLDGAETGALLREEGVGWAYVGPTAKTLAADALERSPDWERVYAAGGAAVYRARWAQDEGR